MDPLHREKERLMWMLSLYVCTVGQGFLKFDMSNFHYILLDSFDFQIYLSLIKPGLHMYPKSLFHKYC
jgi:hypothetical protein